MSVRLRVSASVGLCVCVSVGLYGCVAVGLWGCVAVGVCVWGGGGWGGGEMSAINTEMVCAQISSTPAQS